MMGYYVDVYGKITFLDIEGFKKKFPKKQNKWSYLFTRTWGDKLEKLDAYNGLEIYFERLEGKYWFNDELGVAYLAKYAEGVLYFKGEDGQEWKWTFGEKKAVKAIRPEWKRI